MLTTLFKQYLKLKCNISDRSVGHYITGINTINSLLVKYDFPVKSVYNVDSSASLKAVSEFLRSNSEFLEKDSIGHNMYSAAFRHFCRFAYNDSEFFAQNITAMDVTVDKPSSDAITSVQWKRNPIIVSQAIDSAQYLCECNNAHLTFIAQSTGKAYMEGHHLIPMKYQSLFDYSIDVYANVVCLCPTCHRLMHFGQKSEIKAAAEKLYEIRYARLCKSGIDLTKNDFLKLVIS